MYAGECSIGYCVIHEHISSLVSLSSYDEMTMPPWPWFTLANWATWHFTLILILGCLHTWLVFLRAEMQGPPPNEFEFAWRHTECLLVTGSVVVNPQMNRRGVRVRILRSRTSWQTQPNERQKSHCFQSNFSRLIQVSTHPLVLFFFFLVSTVKVHNQ